jgi:enoyl-CoA hydratase/carnithine racemase
MDGDVATLTLRHPERLNALTGAMLADLDKALAAIEANAQVRALVPRAAPARAFCAGADVREWSELSPHDMGRRWIRDGNRIFARLTALDCITFSIIGADAYGGGLELALATDFRLAATSAKIALPETGIGAIPGWLGIARLTALVGLGRAPRLVLLGETIDAATALDWGLVDGVAAPDALEAWIEHRLAIVRAKSPVALANAKRLFAAIADVDRHAGLHELAAAACRASADGEEGVQAFKAKRKPDFSRRG